MPGKVLALNEKTYSVVRHVGDSDADGPDDLAGTWAGTHRCQRDNNRMFLEIAFLYQCCSTGRKLNIHQMRVTG